MKFRIEDLPKGIVYDVMTYLTSEEISTFARALRPVKWYENTKEVRTTLTFALVACPIIYYLLSQLQSKNIISSDIFRVITLLATTSSTLLISLRYGPSFPVRQSALVIYTRNFLSDNHPGYFSKLHDAFRRASEHEKNSQELIVSADQGDIDSVNRLLDAGAYPNARNHDGDTALTVAARRRNLQIVERLLQELNTDINATNLVGDTALSNSLQWCTPFYRHHQHQAGEDAANTPADQITQTLLNRAASVNTINNDRWTPLMWAAVHGRVDHIQQLLSGGADDTLTNNAGYTALIEAIENRRNLEVIQALLRPQSINTVMTDGSGWTALMWAAHMGNHELTELILQIPGVDTQLRNDEGQSASDIAQNRGHNDIADLINHSADSTSMGIELIL